MSPDPEPAAGRPTPFEAYVAPARARPALWRLALGVALIAAIWLGAVLTLFAAARLAVGAEGYPGWLARLEAGADPAAVLATLATFAGPFAAVLLAAWLLHRRRPRSLLGPAGRAGHDFARAVAVVAGVYGVSFALWAVWFDAAPNLAPADWALWLGPALLALAVQTGAEELMFRGYLLSQLAARFASPVAWAVLPSLLFGAIHWDPALPLASTLAVMGSAALFGLIAADLTARTGTLGAAWGLHLANNAFALLVLAMPGALPGLALRLTPYAASDPVVGPLMLADTATLVIVWLILRRVLGGGEAAEEGLGSQARTRSE